jgi:hypothetical protein
MMALPFHCNIGQMPPNEKREESRLLYLAQIDGMFPQLNQAAKPASVALIKKSKA